MIFVSTGSRKFQFDRLIKKIDELAGAGIITEEVFAQIAETTYIPEHIQYKRYLTPEEFSEKQEQASLVITHAGTGALIGALKKGKQVIAVPRFAKYGEHSDDHQTQVADALEQQGYLRVVVDMEDLADVIALCNSDPITKKYDKPSNIVPIIEEKIDLWFEKGEKKMGLNPIVKNAILFPVNVLYDISPRAALKLLYRLKQGYPLHLKNPVTYSEKLQWIKLYYKNPIMTKLVDKYTVREYINERCPELLVPLLWQGMSPKEIPWDELPEKFVIKVTHGSGFNIIVKDKNKLDKEEAEKNLNVWLKAKFLKCYGEWFYGVEKPRIIIEEYLDCGTGEVPEDYKIMCFSGKPQYIIVDTDRYINHKRNIYNTDWTFREGIRMGFTNDEPIVPPAKELSDKMLEYAKILSKGFPHVRVDLYLVNGKIYFGELTFTNGAGFDKVRPHEFDIEMGSHFKLPKRKKKKK